MPEIMTREQWLNAMTNNLRPLFIGHGYPLPDKLRVTCGWPSVHGLGRKRRIGECWNPECSQDGTTEIFISPLLALAGGAQGISATLYHELIHAAVGTACGHKGAFVAAAKKLGLEGPWTSTTAPAELLAKLAALEPGAYPHASLDATKLTKQKSQTTRMIKLECAACGYVARTTKKWLEERGATICPCNMEPMAQPGAEPEENETEDEGMDLAA